MIFRNLVEVLRPLRSAKVDVNVLAERYDAALLLRGGHRGVELLVCERGLVVQLAVMEAECLSYREDRTHKNNDQCQSCGGAHLVINVQMANACTLATHIPSVPQTVSQY